MKVLVTGGAGFIGSSFVRQYRNACSIVVLDKLTYASDLRRLPNEGIEFIEGDITNLVHVETAIEGCHAVINFAAETHVDNSIEDPLPFAETNYVGTAILLAAAQRHGARYIQVSTDEVYGSISEGEATEDAPIRPSSPYSASKAGADHLVAAYEHTFGLDAAICRGANAFGPGQHPEKFIPKAIEHIRRGRQVPVYGDGQQVRNWLYVDDFAEGIWKVLVSGHKGVFNFGGLEEKTNIEVVNAICEGLGADPRGVIKHIHDRPGHDVRYALDSDRAKALLYWRPRSRFRTGLAQTLQRIARP